MRCCPRRWRNDPKTALRTAVRWRSPFATAHDMRREHRRRNVPMSLRGKIKFAEITDTGKVREHNEDAIGSDPDTGLMVLAAGMGGYNAGEVASGIAVQTVTELAVEGASRESRNELDPMTGLMRQSILLRAAAARANKIIFQTAQSQTHCEGMATTLVAAMFYDNRVSIAHVGDSRAYRLRADKFEQLTLDHSLLQELVDR